MCVESSFYHYGTPKMKWGVRRFQNKDGSLTPEGKKRYGSSDLSRKSDSELSETVKRKNLEKAYRKAIKSDDDGIEKAKKLTDASKTAADSAKDLERKIPSRKRDSLDLKNMTDKEMRDAINRKLLERQYNDMFSAQNANRGREYLRTALEIGGATLGVASSALGIALAIKELKG